MNGHDEDTNNAGNTIDLTLRLGLPSPNVHQHDEDGLSKEKVNAGLNILEDGFNHKVTAWRQPQVGSQLSPAHAQHMYLNNGVAGFCPFPMGYGYLNNGGSGGLSPFPCPPPLGSQLPHHYNNLNLLNPLRIQPPAEAENYTLIDVPPSRYKYMGIGSTSAAASARRTVGMKPRPCGYPYKRCTNYNCFTNDTPMWRRGPLGPKTLCNACGIKYRKLEEEKMGNENDQNPNSDTESA